MSFSGPSLSLFRGVSAVALAALIFVPFDTAFAAVPSSSSGTDFEIPISDLKMVKKKAPQKRVRKEVKKKKTTAGEHKKSSSERAATAETSLPMEGRATEPGSAPLDEQVSQKPSLVAESLPEPETNGAKILHSPYDFVTAGKRTIISAVIDSPADIQEVNCSVRTGNSAERVQVTMVKAPGTRFTYTATLPGLPPKTPELTYTIYVIDTQGRVTRSREFVTLVKSLPFLPGWQIEDSDGTHPGDSVKRSKTGH